MKDLTEPENKRPEPFATVLDLVTEYGYGGVLEALAENARFDAEEPDSQPEDEWLNFQLSHLLEQFIFEYEFRDRQQNGIYHRGVLV
jgi:hypothetical protein